MFADSLPLGFDAKEVIIYEGKGVTYIIRDRPEHSKVQNIKSILQHNDYVKRIVHNTGHENWKKELERTLTQM